MNEEDLHCYSSRQVAELLPALWSEDAKLNPSVKPSDPEMPKGPASDPSHSGDHMAHCADISRAWDRASLTLRQKQVLLLRYGMNWTMDQVCEHFGWIDRSTVQRTETRAIDNIKMFLNGDPGERTLTTQ